MDAVAHLPVTDVTTFMSFLEGRPDEERWELVDGERHMMTPPRIGHQRIASNLERAINDALVVTGTGRRADRRVGVSFDDESWFVPDVTVTDEEVDADIRQAPSVYGVVEVLSSTDIRSASGTERLVVAGKRRKYTEQAALELVLIVRQDEVFVEVQTRAGEAWVTETLTTLTDDLSLPGMGTVCTLAEVYRGLPLAHDAKPKS